MEPSRIRMANGATPLLFAVQNGSLPTIQWLIAHGSQLTERDDMKMGAGGHRVVVSVALGALVLIHTGCFVS